MAGWFLIPNSPMFFGAETTNHLGKCMEHTPGWWLRSKTCSPFERPEVEGLGVPNNDSVFCEIPLGDCRVVCCWFYCMCCAGTTWSAKWRSICQIPGLDKVKMHRKPQWCPIKMLCWLCLPQHAQGNDQSGALRCSRCCRLLTHTSDRPRSDESQEAVSWWHPTIPIGWLKGT